MPGQRGFRAVAVLLFSLVLVAPYAAGLVVTAGALTSEGTVCTANANPSSQNASTELVIMKAPYTISESSAQQEIWTPSIDVHWTSWPGRDDPVLPWPGGPGDKSKASAKHDVKAHTDTFDGAVSVQWDENDLQRDGSYKATVTIDITRESRPWDEGEYQEVCQADDSANIEIIWSGGTGAGGTLIILD